MRTDPDVPIFTCLSALRVSRFTHNCDGLGHNPLSKSREVAGHFYGIAVTRQLKSSCHSLLPQIDRIRRQIVISMIANESSQIDETGKIHAELSAAHRPRMPGRLGPYLFAGL